MSKLKNGDMPAVPTYELNGQGILEDTSYGLTKREHAAIEIMAGMSATNHGYHDYKYMALDAIKQADALLAELENTK